MPPMAGRGRRERERADEDAMRWSFQAMNLLSSTERPVRRLLLDRTKLISTTVQPLWLCLVWRLKTLTRRPNVVRPCWGNDAGRSVHPDGVV